MGNCSNSSVVSYMVSNYGKCIEGPHCVSELASHPSKHIRQLTSSASFLTKVQAIAEPPHAVRTKRKMIETPTCRTKAQSRKYVHAPVSITATHRREFSSPSRTFDAPECPAKWLVLHRAATVKHRKNKPQHVTAQDVGKSTNHSHEKHSLNAMSNHVEQPRTPTATQQLTCEGAKQTL